MKKGGGYKYYLLERKKTDPSSYSFPFLKNRSPILVLLVLLRAWVVAGVAAGVVVVGVAAGVVVAGVTAGV